MKIKDYKCKCGHDNFFFANEGKHVGIYCSNCGKWFKWANKNERNLKNYMENLMRREESCFKWM